MNYLAHLFLAHRSPEGLAGCFLGDFVKGRLGGDCDPALGRGIRLHRRIDSFTDAHRATAASRRRFTGPRRRYAGIIVDLAYDHFLARHWDRYAGQPLEGFAASAYRALASQRDRLPEVPRAVLARMIEGDWLCGYRRMAGLEAACEGVALRLRHGAALAGACDEIRAHYGALEEDFRRFFPDLVEYARMVRIELERPPERARRAQNPPRIREEERVDGVDA